MGIKTGTLIKEARTAAKLTQTALAEKIEGLTAADISKAERGEKELSQTVLKAIAKATGITQSSLLNAEKETQAKPAKETKPKTPKAAKTVKEELTSAEKTLLNLYRKADEDARKDAIRILKGEKTEVEQLLNSMLGGKLSLDKVMKLLK